LPSCAASARRVCSIRLREWSNNFRRKCGLLAFMLWIDGQGGGGRRVKPIDSEAALLVGDLFRNDPCLFGAGDLTSLAPIMRWPDLPGMWFRSRTPGGRPGSWGALSAGALLRPGSGARAFWFVRTSVSKDGFEGCRQAYRFEKSAGRILNGVLSRRGEVVPPMRSGHW